jgi:hypothetical protein
MNIQDIGLDLEFSRRKLLAAAVLPGRGAMAASLFAPSVAQVAPSPAEPQCRWAYPKSYEPPG